MLAASRSGAWARATGSRLRQSPHLAPALALVAVFAISRGAIYLAGVRFDTSPLRDFWQIVDERLLQHHLLQSLWYLHSQPPLFNFWLGLNLKLFPHHLGAAAHVEYLGSGVALVLLLYALLERVTGRRGIAALLAGVFTVSPAVLLYEQWLFYEYPVTVMLLAALFALDGFVRRPTFGWAFGFFALVAMLVYTRSTFQLPWAILAVGLLVWTMPGARRLVLLASVVPMLAIVLLYVKNEIVFGVPSTSSWAGMNLAQVAFADLSPATRNRLIADGTLSKTAAIPPFSGLGRYPSFVLATRKTGIPILDDAKAHGTTNFDNLAYVKISSRYFDDAIALIRARPGIYLAGVGDGLDLFAQPASDDPYLGAANRNKIAHWNAGFDDVVLLRIEAISKTAWTIVLAYLAAAVYGLVLAGRLLRRSAREAADDRFPLLVFAAATVIYATLVITFGEVSENERLRFCLDPVVLLLVAAAGSEVAPRLRRALPQRSTTLTIPTRRPEP